MTAYAMKPTFVDRAGYLRWREQWKTIYNNLAQQISEDKKKIRRRDIPD